MNNVAARKSSPAYSSTGVRLTPLSAKDVFMLDRRAAGDSWADAYRAWLAGAAQRPTFRWLTANELADREAGEE